MVINVPSVVARGIVFSGDSVPSVGIVADSIPKNAKKSHCSSYTKGMKV